MSEIIVGGPACPISDIIRVLKSSPEFNTLDNHLPEISVSLGLSSEQIKQLKQDRLLGKTTLINELDYILEIWVAKSGKDAKLRALINTFTKFGIKSIAELLENAFLSNVPFIPTQAEQKYILKKGPNGLDDFLNGRMEPDTTVLIISAMDAEFTLLKINKFYPHLQVTKYMESEQESQLPEICAFIDCDMGSVEHATSTLTQKQVIITSKEKTAFDTTYLSKLAEGKSFKVIEDFIELDDLSEPFIKIIMERANRLVNNIPFESLKESLSGTLLGNAAAV